MSALLPENRYTTKLNRALDFARATVCENIQLDQLADAACLSKFHFSRIFQDQLGESPIRFIKRTRLERAACLVSNLPSVSITEIASKCGFYSNQLFTRSFGDHFGNCPSKFRSNHVFSMEHSRGHENIDLRYKEFRTIGIHRDSPSTYPQIKIVKLPSTKVAYVRCFGRSCGSTRDAINSIRAWSKINCLWTEDTNLIGVTWDYSSITPEAMRRFDACVAVPDHCLTKPGISFQTIPGGHYAVMQLLYKPGDNHKFYWKWLFLTLYTSPVFQKYAARISSGPWLEVYKPKKIKGKSVVEFYVYLRN